LAIAKRAWIAFIRAIARRPALAVEAVLDHFADDQVGVVVALLRARREHRRSRCSKAPMRGEAKVRKSAISSERVVSHGKTTVPSSRAMRWQSARGSTVPARRRRDRPRGSSGGAPGTGRLGRQTRTTASIGTGRGPESRPKWSVTRQGSSTYWPRRFQSVTTTATAPPSPLRPHLLDVRRVQAPALVPDRRHDDIAGLDVLRLDVAAPRVGHAALTLAGLHLDVVDRVALLRDPLREKKTVALASRSLRRGRRRDAPNAESERHDAQRARVERRRRARHAGSP
jgi:hypothetical protein